MYYLYIVKFQNNNSNNSNRPDRDARERETEKRRKIEWDEAIDEKFGRLFLKKKNEYTFKTKLDGCDDDDDDDDSEKIALAPTVRE